ncbi:sensor histidine kinase [Fredinandcohnia sp. 179-A 10B2 NHS]|uniref:sensor histidine kinase n=1 Tax=Fredinandcohnia sp. 179-A 10B2 NHS TaxID=3235176 RepID=UPI0039A1D5EB
MTKRWVLIRAFSISMVVITTVLFILNIPVLFGELQRVCDTCSLPPEIQKELKTVGLNTSRYAFYLLFTSLLFTLCNVILGILILVKRPKDSMAFLVAITLMLFGLTLTIADPFYNEFPKLEGIARVIGFFSITLLGLVICYFPDHRSSRRLSHFLALSYIIVEVFILFSPVLPSVLEGFLLVLEWSILLLMGYYQIQRYRKQFTSLQRQQTKFPVFAFSISIILVILSVQIPASTIWGNLLGQTLYLVALSLIPLSFSLAIIRYRLWSIDPLINRTLRYGILSGMLLAIYTGIVYALRLTFLDDKTALVSLIGTVGVAIVVQPLHNRLQLIVNKLMYGDRQDPYAAIVRLGERLDVTTSPNRILEAIVISFRDALRLPYAALVWPNGTVAASSGAPGNDPERIDVYYQGEKVAELVVEHRDKDDVWSNEDRQVINNLVRQTGSVIHTLGITKELQLSRQRIVTTREDERRRLRRELHDGLGPEIAAFSFKIAAARQSLNEPAKSDEILSELQIDIRNAVDLIRKLAYNLRPPSLDEYGLGGAISELVQNQLDNNITIKLELPESFPVLGAAVEVAVYRIVQEGLVNIKKHSRATSVSVKIVIGEGTLSILIRDNGIGLPKRKRSGVGIITMRESAEELGGTFFIENIESGGTAIKGSIPFLDGGNDNVNLSSTIS